MKNFKKQKCSNYLQINYKQAYETSICSAYSTSSINDDSYIQQMVAKMSKGPGCIKQMPSDLIPPAWAKKKKKEKKKHSVHPCHMYSSKNKLSLKVEGGKIQSRNRRCPV